MIKDKKTKLLQVRVNEEDYKLFQASAYLVGMNTSSLIRVFFDSTVRTIKLKLKQGDITYEDIENLLND